MGQNPDSHDDLAFRRYRDFDRDFVTIFVFCFRDIKHREDRRRNDENRSVDKVTSRTDPLANPKH